METQRGRLVSCGPPLGVVLVRTGSARVFALSALVGRVRLKLFSFSYEQNLGLSDYCTPVSRVERHAGGSSYGCWSVSRGSAEG